MKACKGLYSTLSKKVSETPHEFFKMLFHRTVEKCNRQLRRKLALPLIAVDSTAFTAGAGKLHWAYLRGEKTGVRLHVQFDIYSQLLRQAEEFVALKRFSFSRI
ncbi:hypothetical protein [Thermoactinomyces mirandus]|uniref:Transposase n=1 Tax=Thermoactinomyces mirandus TaxID=2756294 RepID=A0A7W2ARD5_9BACL|nr:hypothetical protein [Thermoactinomyces mirandus]MBA4601460.1 hypothetical protein [Thermoactinomyces mirandus]